MAELLRKIDAAVSGKTFYLVLGIILFVALIFRVVYLKADPPTGITKSQDFSTDPFQYVYFAKNSVEFGTSNPYNDPRFTQWEKSSENFFAWLVFNIAGTGRAQGNLVGVLFNLGSLLLLALAIKNFGARLGALIFAMLAGLDFVLVWFARTPFLEGAQNFWLCLAVFFFSISNSKNIYYVFAGLACGIAAFFGKMIALSMLGAFVGVWIILYLNDVENRKQTISAAIRFAVGFAVSVLGWFFIIYLPSRGGVSGYLAEQSVGLYGAPKALDSVGDFIWQFVSLLWESDYATKLPVVTLMTFLMGASILGALTMKGKGKKLFGDFNPGFLLILFWFAVGYLALFPWNYRPLRYQTTLMFPAMALAAIGLANGLNAILKSDATKKKSTETGSQFNLPALAAIWGVWLLPFFAILLMWLGSSGAQNEVEKSIKLGPVKYGIFLLLVGGIAGLVYKTIKESRTRFHSLVSYVSLLLLLIFVGVSLYKFTSWSSVRQYSLDTADRDLAAILNKGAVISGPYGPALTQENGFGSIMHMFGVKRVDKDIFRKLPVTHLLMDDGNEKRAREDYKEMMDKATFITRYIVRGFPVRLYRINNLTGNEQASKYEPSDYEQAQYYVGLNQQDSANAYFKKFFEKNIPNYSANLYIADALLAQSKYEEALEFYRKVQQFSPGDAVSAINFANVYLAMPGLKPNTPAYFDSARIYFKMALAAFPNDKTLADKVRQLEKRNQ